MKIVLSSLLSSVLKYNLVKCHMLISSEPCNHANLSSRLIQPFLAAYPATITGNWEKKNHKMSTSLVGFRLCETHAILNNSSLLPGWEKSGYLSIKSYKSPFQARGCKALMLFPV